ncbi:Zinc finger transcription factor family protein 17, partial [Frankliniella fusca]
PNSEPQSSNDGDSSFDDLTRPVDEPQHLVFKCKKCPKVYKSKKALNKHVRNKHPLLVGPPSVLNFECAMSTYKGKTYTELTCHMTNSHNYEDDVEERTFKSMEEFKAWKECTEGKQFVRFVNERGVRELVAGKKILYECHRSGCFVSRGDGIREEKKSCKINAVCPTRMEVLLKDDGTISMTWHQNHLGHEFDVGFMRLTAAEREMIGRRLKNHEDPDSILDDIRDSLTRPSDFKRIHLLEKRDLWNILRKVDFKNKHAHPNDYLSVQALVESLKKRGDKNPVLFFKPQHKPCECSDPLCCLTDSDFMILISTPYQREELSLFTDEKVLIDSTHGTNAYDFQLTTLGSVDSAGVGVPVAYCISNHVSEDFMKQFFRILKDNIKKNMPSTNVFMSDMANEFYNAWEEVFGESENVFYCAWHVDKRWREKTKEKVKGLSKQAEVYRALITLRNILDKEWFEICVLGFRSMLEEDTDTRPFLEYIDKYIKCKEKWAYCYRGGLGLNTNMFMESMFKKLKYSYMKGKKLRRVDECMNILLRWTKNVAFERMTREFKGNNSYRQGLLKESHKKSEEISKDLIEEVETNMAWKVPSSQPGSDQFYNVTRNADNTCSGCLPYCNHCSVCAHEFKCSCLDFVSHGNMCKHIHAVASTHMVFFECERRPGNLNHAIEVLCLATENVNVGNEVEQNDMWNPVCDSIKTCLDRLSGVNVSEQLFDGSLKFLELLRKELQNVSATSTSPLPSSPSTPLRTRTENPSMFTPHSTPGSNNRRFSTQRRLVNFCSTKKKPVKKTRNLAKPTFNQQGSYIASFSFGRDQEVMNIHARDFDHIYSQMDIDDNY